MVETSFPYPRETLAQPWTDNLPVSPRAAAASATTTIQIELKPAHQGVVLAFTPAANVTAVTITGMGTGLTYATTSTALSTGLLHLPVFPALDDHLAVAVTVNATGPVNVTAVGVDDVLSGASQLGITGSSVNLIQVGGAAIALGQAAMAASLPVAIASNQGNVPENLTQVGGAAIALGQAAMAASVPVAIANNQGNVPANITQIGGAALALGQAVMASSLPVAIASNQGNVPENLAQVGGAAVALGQAAMASSVPVVIANNQSNVPANITQVGGAALALGQAAMAASIPVAIANNQAALAQNVAGSQVTSTASSAQLVAARSTRQHCLIRNQDAANSVWVGESAATTSKFVIKAGESIDYQSGAALFVIDNGSHAVLDILDMY